jgi:hypothetical protein
MLLQYLEVYFNWRGQFVSRAQSLLGTERRDASQFSEQRPSELMLGHRKLHGQSHGFYLCGLFCEAVSAWDYIASMAGRFVKD